MKKSFVSRTMTNCHDIAPGQENGQKKKCNNPSKDSESKTAIRVKPIKKQMAREQCYLQNRDKKLWKSFFF